MKALCIAVGAAMAAAGAVASDDMQVYFGCGCFWHMQHGFVQLEESLLGRSGGSISARTAYAGGTQAAADGLVCYHNGAGVADYGKMGHAEAVSLSVPKEHFAEFAARFWQLCPKGQRQDVQDLGGEYRSVIGVPGGLQSDLASQLHSEGVQLVDGRGNEDDTLNSHKVLVYDSTKFPAHVAEQFHQFHDDMMESYGGDYNALQRFAVKTKCPGDAGGPGGFWRLFSLSE
mmetsp:Transcript_118600/g.332106  ORF Transcript_118600/g.332106 Transcript_118600/m.332106 type:complete len:230 (-) Transcript_118600:224-913(-)